MEFPGPPRNLLAHQRILLAHPEISPWNFVAHRGISWLTQKFPGSPRNFLAHPGISWLTQGSHHGISGLTQESHHGIS